MVRNSSNLSNGLAFDRRDRLIVCERGRLTRTDDDGRITILAESYGGKGLHWPNDVVVRSDGAIFFTDLKQPGEWANPAKTGFNAVYRLSPDNQLVLFSQECQSPNGIALSPNDQVLYVSDTATRTIRSYKLGMGDLPTGEVFVETSTAGGPDGVGADALGNVWVCEDEGIVVFNSEASHLITIRLPEAPSNCTFSKNRSVLFVTAKTSVYEVDIENLLG